MELVAVIGVVGIVSGLFIDGLRDMSGWSTGCCGLPESELILW